jgi:soluble cytochrome b562
MIPFNQLWVVGVISLFVLAGCNSTEQSATQTSPDASSATSETVTPPKASGTANTKQENAQGGFKDLHNVVSKTKTAVEAGDFAKAKAEFSKFEDSWSKVEDGVKAKSRDRYNAIEENMDAVTKPLKESKPSKQKILGALQSLDQAITSVTKP